MQRILRLPEVIKNTGLKRSTIYKLMAAQGFPIQISLGAKSVGWLESDIENWIQDRISKSQIALKSISQTGGNYANR